MNAEFQRHDLLWISEEGRAEALRAARPLLAEATDEMVAALIMNPGIPAIVSRQEERHGNAIEAGFSSPEKYGGIRLRVATKIRLTDIERAMTPFRIAEEIAQLRNSPRSAVIKAILAAAADCGLSSGFFGSTALQTVTGLPYTDENSDIDVYVRPAGEETGEGTGEGTRTPPDPGRFHRAALELEARHNTRIDIELDIGSGFAVKLKELLSPTRTVLAKGLHSVEILAKDQILRAAAP